MESKNEKFRRLSTPRVNKTLDDFRKIGNLISASYSSSQEERRKIISILRKGLEDLEYTFSGEKGSKTKTFSWNESPEEENNE